MKRNRSLVESSWSRPKLPDLNSSSWEEVQRQMHVGDFVLVLHKKLTTSDVNPHQSRVFLNKEWMEKDLIPQMNAREVSLLLGNESEGLPVTALYPARWRYGVVIKLWPTINQYALKKEWMKIVKKNRLKKDDSVCIWAFRRGDNGELCLFIEVDCAVVTGANKGIRLEISRQLASNGITVILTARDEKRGMEAVANIKESGPSDVVFHQLDVKDSVSIASLANFIKTQFGKVDILANNAGENGLIIDHEGVKASQLPLGKIDEEKMELASRWWQETYERAEQCPKTNYYGSKSVTEALLPLLHLSKSPGIVNVSSILGRLKFIPNEKFKEEVDHVDGVTEERLDEWLQSYLKDFKEERLDKHGWPTTMSAYKISKAALNAYTRILAKKFPTFCINSVHPGAVKTDMNCFLWTRTVEEGAGGPVMLALLPDGGSSGHFFDQMEMSTY